MQSGSPWPTSRLKTHFTWPLVFFKHWMELPTVTTQKYGFWALLLKNGKIWQHQMTLLPCNDGQGLRSNVQTSHCPLVLPSQDHMVFQPWLHPLWLPERAHTCASALGSPLPSSGKVDFEQDLERWIQRLCYFITSRGKTPADFIPPF